MIERFLKAKHWMIFIIIFVIPYSLEAIAMIITENDIDKMIYFKPVTLIIFFLGLFGWFWSIVTGLQGNMPEGVKMKVRKFKILLIFPMIYIPFAFNLSSTLGNSFEESNGVVITLLFATIFIFHILSMFGLIYSFYFVAKTYKTVELQREVIFSDFAGELFMFMIFPIGVWILQPRINLMIS